MFRAMSSSQLDGSTDIIEGDREEGEVRTSSDDPVIIEEIPGKRKKSQKKFERDRKKYKKRVKKRPTRILDSSSDDEVDKANVTPNPILGRSILNITDYANQSGSSTPKETRISLVANENDREIEILTKNTPKGNSSRLLTGTPIETCSRLITSTPKVGSLRLAKGLEGENASPNVSIFDEPTQEIPQAPKSIFDIPTQEIPTEQNEPEENEVEQEDQNQTKGETEQVDPEHEHENLENSRTSGKVSFRIEFPI